MVATPHIVTAVIEWICVIDSFVIIIFIRRFYNYTPNNFVVIEGFITFITLFFLFSFGVKLGFVFIEARVYQYKHMLHV